MVEESVVNLATNRTIYGIELLNANEQIKKQDLGKLLIVNEATGFYNRDADSYWLTKIINKEISYPFLNPNPQT